MFENLEDVVLHFKEIEQKISDPDVMKDMNHWRKLVIEHADLKPIIEKYEEYKDHVSSLEEDKELLEMTDDHEMIELLHEEIKDLEKKIDENVDELNILLLPFHIFP